MGISAKNQRIGGPIDHGTWDAAADAQLRRLCRHRGLPVTGVAEQLAGRAERAVVDRLSDADQRRYLWRL